MHTRTTILYPYYYSLSKDLAIIFQLSEAKPVPLFSLVVKILLGVILNLCPGHLALTPLALFLFLPSALGMECGGDKFWDEHLGVCTPCEDACNPKYKSLNWCYTVCQGG